MSKRSTLWLEQMATAMKQHGVVGATRKLTKSNGTVEELTVQLAAPVIGNTDTWIGKTVSPTVVQVVDDEEEVAATPDEVARAAKRRRYENLFPGITDEILDTLPEFPS